LEDKYQVRQYNSEYMGQKLLIVVSCFALAILIGCTGYEKLKVIDDPDPVFVDVTVHDPAIFRAYDDNDADRFRIIGSFLGSARTGDFMRWKLEQAGGGQYSTTLKYYPQDNPDPNVQTVVQQRADVLRPARNDGFNFFASDIQRMPNGKYYHYYSMTSTWRCSAIGLAIADAVDGPYITQGLFVRSAEAGSNMTPDGTRPHSSNGNSVEPTNHPNCIDAQAFFDKDGNHFYLVYGSWSGGIFLFEIDVETGLPKDGVAMNAESNGYGRQLIANCHSGIEAPYVIYSPETDYYYLFVSFAGLAANGGYNMRIFRSRLPYGPYEDATHPVTASDPNPLATKNLSPSAASPLFFGNYGVKIMGGYHFVHQAEQEPMLNNHTGKDGFLSPGHNSAYYDPETMKYYLIYHTRFVYRGEEHQVRVREMFVNEDGWLIASPFRYDAGTMRTFNAKQLSGKWKIINHGTDNNTSAHESQSYTFNKNGTITGSGKGKWELKPDEKTAHIMLDGKLYKGLFLRCYDEYHSMWVYAFTAMSEDGIALWGTTMGIRNEELGMRN
jgi:arabinan endo-1,5-alpha-L-arabinosidase